MNVIINLCRSIGTTKQNNCQNLQGYLTCRHSEERLSFWFIVCFFVKSIENTQRAYRQTERASTHTRTHTHIANTERKREWVRALLGSFLRPAGEHIEGSPLSLSKYLGRRYMCVCMSELIRIKNKNRNLCSRAVHYICTLYINSIHNHTYMCTRISPPRSTKHPVSQLHAHYQLPKQNTALPIPIQATIAKSHYQLNLVTSVYRFCIISAE